MTENEMKQQTKVYNPDEPFIFISYDSDDSSYVFEDVCVLQKAGFNLWLDKKDISGVKKTWETDVKDVILHENCRLLIFYLSRHSLSSENCLRELLQVETNEDLDFLLVEAESVPDHNLNQFLHSLLADLLDAELEFGEKIKKLETLLSYKHFFEQGDYFGKSLLSFRCSEDKAKHHYYHDIRRNLSYVFDLEITGDTDILTPQAAAPAADRINQEISYPNGDRYTGQVKETGESGKFIPHGIGRMHYADGFEYLGEWVDGQKNGIGKLTYPKDLKKTVSYFGGWKDGKKNGQGVTSYRDGNTLLEEWKSGAPIRKAKN